MQLHFSLQDEIATVQIGAALAEHLPPGAIVALNGPLGAGKTRLVQTVATQVFIRYDFVVYDEGLLHV